MNEPVKPRWYSGQDLVTKWGIKGFELFDLMKNGLQAYTNTGKKVVNSDPLPRAKRDSLEKIEANQRAKVNATIISHGHSRGPSSDDEIKQTAKRIYDAQRLEIIDPPKDCELMSFTLPNNHKLALLAISKALCFQFKSEDVLKYFNNDKDSLLTNGAMKVKREKIEKVEADNADDTVKPFLSKIGKKGGLQPKKIEPIMEAAKKFMLDDEKLIDMGLEKITKKFSNKFKEGKPMCVNIDGIKYEIFCQGELVISRPGENYDGRKNKNQEKTIKYTTFMKNYISKAKESILSKNSKQ